MKTLRVVRTGIIGILLLLLVSFFSFGNVRVAAQQDHHGSMKHSRSTSFSECQTRCNSVTGTIALPQQDNDLKEKEPGTVETQKPQPYPFVLGYVRNLITNPDTDSRLLRPPDKLALNCIYRI